MAELFRRNFTATITNETSLQFINVAGLRISFKVTKVKKDKGNKAVINIYNLSPLNRSSILAPNTKTGSPQISISLFAGYGSEATLLFKGVGNSATKWTSPDYISTFTVEDGSTARASRTFERKYPKLTPLDLIIGNLLAAVNLPLGIIQPTGVSLLKSRSFSGSPDSILQSLASSYGFSYDTQDGRSNILQTGFSSVRTFAFLGSETGLIGVPYWEGSIVKARCLILPAIAPNTVVVLTIPITELAGPYVVAKATIKGDNWGSSAFMDLELEPRNLESLYETLPNVEKQI